MLTFSQLIEPNSDNPMCVIGLRPLPLVEGEPFRAPLQLLQLITPLNKKDMQFSITPKFSVVNAPISKLITAGIL